MEKTRLLFISHPSNFYGGAQKSLFDILENIDKDKYEIYLICPNQGYFIEQAEKTGVTIFIINYKWWLSRQSFAWRMLYHIPINIVAVLKIAGVIRKLGVHLTYTNTAVVISGALASKMCNVPHIWHIHETIGREADQFQHFLGERLIFGLIDKLSTRIIANAYKTKEIFPQGMQHKISVVYNGFNVKPVNGGKTSNNESRIRIESADNELIIAIVGNLCDRKGQRVGILAMPMILRRYPSAKLIIVGGDSSPGQVYIKTLKSLAKQYSLDNHVLFVGYHKNLDEIYAKTALLLVPSSAESFGRVIVEAMLAGVPVIATGVGGIPEIIEHERTGILLQNRDPNELAKAVIDLLSAEGKRVKLTLSARIMAEQRFGMDIMIRKIEDVILNVDP